MPRTRHHSYDLNFELKIVAEAEAVKGELRDKNELI